jgi:hypothetical protein
LAIIVAEYLGQKLETEEHIKPFAHHEEDGKGLQFEEKGTCPFIGQLCKKMDKKKNAKFPVCSLRRSGELYIVCEHRLASTCKERGGALSPYQSNMLLSLAREVFSPEITVEQLLFKSEVYIASTLSEEDEEDKQKKFGRADYLLCITPDVVRTHGHRKLIVEMQGGGETSDTGNMTEQLKEWTRSELPTNEILSRPLDVGFIQTNAWRRLQEQLLTKGSVAVSSGYGFVACIGTHVFDQVEEKLNGFDDIRTSKEPGAWDTALIAYSEDKSPAAKEIVKNAIPLKIDQDRILYTTYKALATKLIDRGVPIPEIFNGPWLKLTGEAVNDDGTPFVRERRSRSKKSLSR